MAPRNQHINSQPPDRPIPSQHILPPSPLLTKHLNRLSKPSLISLVKIWLSNSKKNNAPDLSPTEEDEAEGREEDVLIEDVIDIYENMKTRKLLVERVFEREWVGTYDTVIQRKPIVS